MIRAFGELWCIVIYVLDFDDELSHGLQKLACNTISDFGGQCVFSLLLAVQPLHRVDVTCLLIDGKDGACPLTCKAVSGCVIVHLVCVKLQLKREEK